MVRARGIVFCGGGTGGHVMPGLALAAACQAQGARDLRWIGDPQRLEARLVPAADIPLLPWGLARPRLRSWRWWLQALRRLAGCWWVLHKQPPRVVVALGGYAALIPGLLAPLMGRPLVVLEQNAWPGRTNRLLARRARVVVTAFAEARQGLPAAKIVRLGNPVRSFAPRPRGSAQRLNLLVMGGSLAARSLNDCLAASAPALAALTDVHVVHLAGAEDVTRMRDIYAAAGLSAEVHGYIEDMQPIYAQADIALCRSGATTVAECRSAGLGAIYVPLPWAAEDHQTANARAVARRGGAVVLPQSCLLPEALLGLMRRLLADRSLVAYLGQRARAQAQPQAAAKVAELCQKLASDGRGQPRW